VAGALIGGIVAVAPESASAGIDALALDELVEEGFAPGDGAGVVEEHGVLADAGEGVGEFGTGAEQIGDAGGHGAFEQGQQGGDVFGALGRVCRFG
jgi:hypothetical protein